MRRLSIILFLVATSASAQSTLATMEADLNANPDRMGLRLQLADEYVRQSQYDKVIHLLNAYTDQLPAEGFLALAASYSGKKDYAGEIRILGVLSAKHEDDYRWHMLSGQAYLKSAAAESDREKKRDLTTSAIQQLRKVLQAQPKYRPAFDLLLATQLRNKFNNDARELLLEGLSKFGDRPEFYRDLCRLDSTDGFLVQAVTNCRMAIKLEPQFPDSYVYLVQSLYDQKEGQHAENDVIVAAKRFPKSEFVQWAAGMLFLKKKNFPVSGRYFRAALAADGKSIRAHYGLAQSLFESGEEKEALEHFLITCSADPTSIDIFLADGGRLKQNGNYRLGEEFVQKANACRK